jgi:hypothetical protein
MNRVCEPVQIRRFPIVGEALNCFDCASHLQTLLRRSPCALVVGLVCASVTPAWRPGVVPQPAGLGRQSVADTMALRVEADPVLSGRVLCVRIRLKDALACLGRAAKRRIGGVGRGPHRTPSSAAP